MPSKTVMCAILVLGMTIHAAQRVPKKPPVDHGGLIAVVDPVTRQIREATPNEIGALSPQAAAQPAATPPVAIQGLGGAVGVVLGPEFRMHAVATKTVDGKVRLHEVSGETSVDGK